MGMGAGGGGGGQQGASMTSFNGTSTVTPPAEVLDMYRSINPLAQKAASTPWENYSNTPDGFVAQINDTQNSAIQGLDNNIYTAQPYTNQGMGSLGSASNLYGASSDQATAAGNGVVANYGATNIASPYYNNAMNLTADAASAPGGYDVANPYLQSGAGLIGYGGQGTNQVSAQDINQYLSPYQNDVINSTMGLLSQQNNQAMSGALGNAIESGGFGGDRAGIAAANLAQQQELANANVLGGLENQNYSQALSTAVGQRGQNQADLQRAIQAGQGLGQIGSQAGSLQQSDLQRQLAAGQQEAAIGTQQYQNYTAQQAQQQQDLQRQLAASQQLANNASGLTNLGNSQAQMGINLNNSINQGLESQLGAGTLQQQTEQAGKDAMYNQWLQMKAYPFMTTQWLADIYGGLGPLYGSTTTQSGTSMSMPLGFSDPRLKGGVGGFSRGGDADKPEVIGKTFDDQPIYRYSMMGGAPQLGLMADEVAQKQPEHVYNVDGLLAMDYAGATDDAARIGHHLGANHREHFAGGGLAGALAAQSQMYANKHPGQAGPGGNSFVPQGKGGGHGALTPTSINVPKAELTQPKVQHPPPDIAGSLEKMKGLAGLGGKGGGLGNLFGGSGSGGLGGAFDTAASTSTPAATTAAQVASTPAPSGEEFPKVTPASTDSAPLPPARPSDLSSVADATDSTDYGTDGAGGVSQMADADLGMLDFAARGGRIGRSIGGVMPFNNESGSVPFAPNGGSMPFEQGMKNNIVPASVLNDQHHPQMMVSQPPDMMKMSGQGGGGKKGGGEGGKQAEQMMKQGMDQMKGLMEKGTKGAEAAPTKITEQATKPVQDAADKTQLADSVEHAADGVQNTSSQAENGLGNIGEHAANGAENDASQGLGEVGKDLGNNASEAASGLENSASEGLGDLGSSLGDAGGSLGDVAGDASAGLADAAGDGLMGASEDAAAGLGDMAAEAGADAAAAGAEAAAGAAGGGLEGLGALAGLLLLKRGGRVSSGRKKLSTGGPDSEATSDVSEVVDTPTPDAPVELVEVEKKKPAPVEQAVQVADAATSRSDAPADDGFNRHVGTVLKVEGGYTPDDAGHGPSNRGINAAAHPGMDIKNISEGQARDIYRREYWDGAGIGNLPEHMRGLAFDASVNQGPGRARAWAQQAGDDPYKLYKLRQEHYQSLVDRNPGKYAQYANSWNGRLNAQAQLAGIKDISNLQVNGHPARNTGGGPEYLDRSMMASTDGHEQQIGPGAEESGGLGALDVILPLAAAGAQYAVNRHYHGAGAAAASALASGLGTLGGMRTAGLEEERARQKMELEQKRFDRDMSNDERSYGYKDRENQRQDEELKIKQREFEAKEAQRKALEDAYKQNPSSSEPEGGYGPKGGVGGVGGVGGTGGVNAPPVAPPSPPVQPTPNNSIQVAPEEPVKSTQPPVQRPPVPVEPTGTTPPEQNPVSDATGVASKVNAPTEPPVAPPAPVEPAPKPAGTPDPAKFWPGSENHSNPYFFSAKADEAGKMAAKLRQSPYTADQAAKWEEAQRFYLGKARDAATSRTVMMKDGTVQMNPWAVQTEGQAGASIKAAEMQAGKDVENRNSYEEIEPIPGGPKQLIRKDKLLEQVGVDPTVIKSQPAWVQETRNAQAKEEVQIPNQMKGFQLSLTRLKRMQEIQQSLQTGKFEPQKAEIYAALDSLGIPIDKKRLRTAEEVQQFLKNGVANTFEQVKAMGGRPLVAEIEGLARANANAALTPEANRQIIARSIGQIQYNTDYLNDYVNWRRENPYTIDTMRFDQEWMKTHDIHDYENRAADEATAVGSHNPPAKPTVLPPVDQRVAGKTAQTIGGKTYLWNGQGWAAQ